MKLLPYARRLARLLAENGVDKIVVPRNVLVSRRDVLQSVFLAMMLEGLGVCRYPAPVNSRLVAVFNVAGYGSIEIHEPGGKDKVSYYLGRCDDPLLSSMQAKSTLLGKLEPPLFVVDLNLPRYMGGREDWGRIMVSISASLELVRNVLYDKNLVVTGIDGETREYLESTAQPHDVFFTEKTTADTLWTLGIEDVVIITPLASKPLKQGEVESIQAFVLPAVSYWEKRMERYLSNMVPWASLRRLELRGSSYGIPHTVNFALGVILDSLYGDHKLEDAILNRLGRQRLYSRLVYEAKKIIAGEGKLDDIEERLSWLTRDRRLINKAIEEALEEGNNG